MRQTQNTAILTTDTIFSWRPTERGFDCQCRLKIYQKCSDQRVVIFSISPDLPETTFSRTIPPLIRQVNHRFNLSPQKTMWLEHYPGVKFKTTDDYFQLSILQDRVSRFKMAPYQIKLLLGQKV